jgi:hypothetical protein
MSNHRRRLDRATAERLLSGDPAAAPTGQESLAHLLAAAAAPGRHRELAGEQAAMVAFRTAHRVPPTQQRSRSMISLALGKILTAKAVAVVAATTIGGVAVAAGTGHLPTQHRPEASSQSQGAETSETGPETGEAARAKARSHTAAGTPSPSMVGLCRAYAAGEKASHGKALDNPAFTALVTASGGKAKVSAWCTTLLAQEKAEHSAGSPTQSSTGHSTAGPHPTGAPTEHPTGHPTPTTTPTPHGGP